MNRFRISLTAILLLTLLGTVRVTSTQTSEEGAGQAAEQAGKAREAATHYVAAFQSTTEGSDAEQRLQEKIISLVLKLDPPLALPKDAERFMARGQAAIEDAKGEANYRTALAEFQKASRLAPWWADVYYNLGAVHEKLGDYAESIRNLKLYLLAAPNSQDAKAVEGKIFKLEFKQEQIAKARAEAEERERRTREEQLSRAEEARREEERRKRGLPIRLAGDWRHRSGRGFLYRIEVSGTRFELYQVRDVDGNPTRELEFDGTIENGEISGYWVQSYDQRGLEGGCVLRRGRYSGGKAELSSDERELVFYYPYNCRGEVSRFEVGLRR